MIQSLTTESFVSLLGGFPKRLPLDGRVLQVQKFNEYTRKLVEYTIEGKERVQAFLLIPKCRKRKSPGILAIHQDGEHRPYEYGKSEPAGVAGDPELQYGLELCLRGYVVICPDRFPFESRSLADSRFKDTFSTFKIFARYKDGEVELTEDLYRGCVANRLLIEGKTQLGNELFEMQRALDYLSAEQKVDSGRIGVIGHSAGGLLSALMMYVDPRVKVGCASCGTFLFRWIWRRDSIRPINGFAGLAVPGLKNWGDVDDILAGLAPRPFLETEGNQGISQEMSEEKVRKARARYEELGVSERFQHVVYKGGHVFRKDMREKSYRWFDRWLK